MGIEKTVGQGEQQGKPQASRALGVLGHPDKLARR
jgi:hypothetical protein